MSVGGREIIRENQRRQRAQGTRKGKGPDPCSSGSGSHEGGPGVCYAKCDC